MTTLCDLVGQAIQKKEEEKRIAEEQAAKDQYWKIPICYDDDEDDTIIITLVLPIEEPVNSLSMGDKHLDTILETESDEFIKSSVEDLVPIPSGVRGYPDKMCDDIDYVDASPLDVEIVSLEGVEIVDPEVGRIDDDILLTIKDDILQKSSGSTTTHVDFSQYDSFIFDVSNDHFPNADRSDFYREKFADKLAHINVISLPNL
ncbi:hypothetical protein Tco_0781651 [Tanacetum coccineum]